MIVAAAPWAIGFFILVVGLRFGGSVVASIAEQSGVVRALAVVARERRNPIAALAADVAVALVAPFSTGVTHAVVSAYLGGNAETRALRTMALSSLLRLPVAMLLGLLAISREAPRAFSLGAVVVAVAVVWAIAWSMFAPRGALSAHAYVQHRGAVDVRAAASAALQEIGEYLSLNLVRVVLVSLIGAWLVVKSVQPQFGLEWPTFLPLMAFIALAVKVDPMFMLPIEIGNYCDGAPPEGLLVFLCVAGACTARTQNVVDALMKDGAAQRFRRAIWFTYTPLVVVAFFALLALR